MLMLKIFTMVSLIIVGAIAVITNILLSPIPVSVKIVLLIIFVVMFALTLGGRI